MKLNLPTIPEPTNAEFTMYNTGSVDVEEGEFLYALVKMIKPMAILETGTYKGVSTSCMATALKENGKGKITTLEYEPIHYKEADALFDILGLSSQIDSVLISSLDYKTDLQYDFIFLDTEPNIRFGEFIKYWPNLKPGGFIGIHDLNAHMGQTGQVVNEMMDWPFGTMPDEMKRILREECQSFHFPTPRGFFLGQKFKEGDYEVQKKA
jgi:predicted O-methyltransferase YrrM